MREPGRNEPCICGSTKKYKHCCRLKSNAGKAAAAPGRQLGRLVVFAIILVVGAWISYLAFQKSGIGSGIAAVSATLIALVAAMVFRDPPPPKTGGSDAAAINFGG